MRRALINKNVTLIYARLVILNQHGSLGIGMKTGSRLGNLRKCFTAAVLVGGLQGATSSAGAAQETAPLGSYVWYPGDGGPKTDSDCVRLVEKLKPTKEMVQQWYWGRAPKDDFSEVPYFLIVSADRMETTFSAEGDFDYGSVKFGGTRNGETRFMLKPDEHPDTAIEGEISAPSDSQIVKVTLFRVPFDDESKDRISYFCRFQSDDVET